MAVQPPHPDPQTAPATGFVCNCCSRRKSTCDRSTQHNRIVSAVPHFCGEWIPMPLTISSSPRPIPWRRSGAPRPLGPNPVPSELSHLARPSPRNGGEEQRRRAESVCRLLDREPFADVQRQRFTRVSIRILHLGHLDKAQ